MTAAGATSLKVVGASTLVVGFEQIGQKPGSDLLGFGDTTQKYAASTTSEGARRTRTATWDGGTAEPWSGHDRSVEAARSTRGKGQWLDRYGDGGGSSKVSFVGEVETEFGTLVRGTFVIAKKKDGKTNSHTPADAHRACPSETSSFQGDSAFQPMNPDKIDLRNGLSVRITLRLQPRSSRRSRVRARRTVRARSSPP